MLALGCVVACSARASKRDAPVAVQAAEVPFSEKQGGGSISGATAESAIAYAGTSRAQKLDLFLPRSGTKPFPVVVRIHGGAFQSGSARTATQGPAAERIIAAGYALAAVSYRLTPEAPFPAGARDVKAAVRFLRANAARWDLDPTRFAAWGESSGGWLAVMLGVTGDQPSVFDDPSLGNANASSAVQAVVDWYGPTDFLDLDAQHAEHPPVACVDTYQRHSAPGTPESTWLCGDRTTPLADPSCMAAVHAANLIGYIATARELPHFAIAHGADDCEVPWWQSVVLFEALKKRDVLASFTKIPRAGHADVQVEAAETGHALEMLAKTFHPDPDAGAPAD